MGEPQLPPSFLRVLALLEGDFEMRLILCRRFRVFWRLHRGSALPGRKIPMWGEGRGFIKLFSCCGLIALPFAVPRVAALEYVPLCLREPLRCLARLPLCSFEPLPVACHISSQALLELGAGDGVGPIPARGRFAVAVFPVPPEPHRSLHSQDQAAGVLVHPGRCCSQASGVMPCSVVGQSRRLERIEGTSLFSTGLSVRS